MLSLESMNGVAMIPALLLRNAHLLSVQIPCYRFLQEILSIFKTYFIVYRRGALLKIKIKITQAEELMRVCSVLNITFSKNT